MPERPWSPDLTRVDVLTRRRTWQVDLTGGYYDGGDNVKFGFPMAFTTTTLSWSVLEHGGRMPPRARDAARDAVRWGADYLLKAATRTPGRLYVGVGDADADHRCWERPEDMDTPRTVYAVSASAPGSDVAGETAAALAAASGVFRAVDKAYATRLLDAARGAMELAVRYQGKYSDHVGGNVGAYYASYSGYKVRREHLLQRSNVCKNVARQLTGSSQDELLWGSAWLLWATKNSSYLNYLTSLGANDGVDMFSWDNKLAGARVLLARVRDDPRSRSTHYIVVQLAPCHSRMRVTCKNRGLWWTGTSGSTRSGSRPRTSSAESYPTRRRPRRSTRRAA